MNFSTTINLFPKTLSKKIKSRQRRVVGLLLNKTAKYCNEDFMAKVNKSHVWPDSRKIKLCNLLNFKMSFSKDDLIWNWLMLTCRRILFFLLDSLSEWNMEVFRVWKAGIVGFFTIYPNGQQLGGKILSFVFSSEICDWLSSASR